MRPTVKANSRRISSPEIARRFRTLIVRAAKPGPVGFTGRVEGKLNLLTGQCDPGRITLLNLLIKFRYFYSALACSKWKSCPNRK